MDGATGNLRAMKKAPTQVSPRRRSAGFTLLELMITISVLAILVGVGIPSFRDMMRRNRLVTQTNELIGALALARSEAVKRGLRVTICPANATQDACSDSGDWADGMIIFTDALGTVGTVDEDEDDPNNNDAILQRLPAAAAQKVRINNPLILISYMQNGNLELPPGDDARFVVASVGCRSGETDAARQIQVIAAGRASARSVPCPSNPAD